MKFSLAGDVHCRPRDVVTGWTEVDMSTPLLPEVVPEIDANPVSFTGGGKGVGQVWSLTRQSLPYVNFNDNAARDDAAGDDNTVLYLQFLTLMYHNYLGFREFAKYGE